MAKRWEPNWFDTCWLAMLSRSAWMLAWLMVSLKTQTFGPKAATFAPAHIDDADLAGRAALALAALAALADPAANPAAAARAAARIMTGRSIPRAATALMMVF